MNRLKALVRSIFGFSRMETNAFLILLPLMTLILFSEPVYRFIVVRQEEDFSKEIRELDSLSATWNLEKTDNVVVHTFERKKFRFDPNKATEKEFLALGFSNTLTKTILNYRTKGGKFFVKSDLKKIYGIDSSLYVSLKSFINLPETRSAHRDSINFVKPVISRKLEVESFDLNLADTSQLKSIYGIGTVLAGRIIAYRQKLGGFVSKDQLSEIYGLDSAARNRLRQKSFVSRDFLPVLININQADEKTLASHPYIRSSLAKSITTYRFQHGNFKTIDDLNRIQSIKPGTIVKLEPYLSF